MTQETDKANVGGTRDATDREKLMNMELLKYLRTSLIEELPKDQKEIMAAWDNPLFQEAAWKYRVGIMASPPPGSKGPSIKQQRRVPPCEREKTF